MHEILEHQLKEHFKDNTPSSPEFKGFLEAVNAIYENRCQDEKLVQELQADKQVFEEKARILSENLRERDDQTRFLEQSKQAMNDLLEETWRAKEKLELEDSKFQSIITSVGDGLLLINGDYKIELANPKIEDLFKMTKEELVGKDLREVIKVIKKKKDELPPAAWPIEEMFLTKKTVSTNLEDELSIATLKREDAFPVLLSAAPLRGSAGGVIVIRDATKDRELDEAKSGFISVASHQLRTPLTTIRWYAEILLSGEVGKLDPVQHDFLEEIHGGVRRLHQTIDLLLGISRVESGKTRPERIIINLKSFTEDIVHELTPLAQEKKLVVNVVPFERDVMVSLDRIMLRQVILNLLSNAIRYSNEDGAIEMRWSVVGEEVLYSVHDNGIGIPEAQRKRIFSKFFRAENAVAKVPDGSGLGLALVKDLVEAWGGKVWFESVEGQGTTFFFTVPPPLKEPPRP